MGRGRVWLLFSLLCHLVSASIFQTAKGGRCEPIDIDLCKDIPYNRTFFPNPRLGDQQSSSTEHFKPLIMTNCNPHIKFFVCSVFAPMCPDAVPQAVTSCRSVCEQVKKDCVQFLHEFGIEWPEPLNCSRFPQPPELCMNPPDEVFSGSEPTSLPERPGGYLPECPSNLINVDPLDVNGVCAFPCDQPVMFTWAQKEKASSWSVKLALVALVLNVFTFFTFLIDTGRFRFPERSVFYLSLCYVFHALPYAAALLWTTHERGCEKLKTGQSFLVSGSSLTNNVCVASFFLSYYFSLASSLWWLLFTFTWYLAAGRKWVPEGISAIASYLHLVAWGLPALLTAAVLIDASELTSVCGVGNSQPTALLFFSLLPRVLLVLVGASFLIAGLAAMCKERKSFRLKVPFALLLHSSQGTDTSKLEKLMLKMGLFCALYIIPAVTVVVSEGYEFLVLREWFPRTVACKGHGGAENCKRPPLPQWEVYLLKLLMSLAVGVSTAMWIFSKKTLYSWQRFLFCGLCSEAPHKAPPASIPLLTQPSAPMRNPPHPPSAHYIPSSQWRSGMQL